MIQVLNRWKDKFDRLPLWARVLIAILGFIPIVILLFVYFVSSGAGNNKITDQILEHHDKTIDSKIETLDKESEDLKAKQEAAKFDRVKAQKVLEMNVKEFKDFVQEVETIKQLNNDNDMYKELEILRKVLNKRINK